MIFFFFFRFHFHLSLSASLDLSFACSLCCFFPCSCGSFHVWGCQVVSVHFSMAPMTALLTSASSSGVVVDLGYRHSSCTAVYDRRCLTYTHQCTHGFLFLLCKRAAVAWAHSQEIHAQRRY